MRFNQTVPRLISRWRSCRGPRRYVVHGLFTNHTKGGSPAEQPAPETATAGCRSPRTSFSGTRPRSRLELLHVAIDAFGGKGAAGVLGAGLEIPGKRGADLLTLLVLPRLLEGADEFGGAHAQV